MQLGIRTKLIGTLILAGLLPLLLTMVVVLYAVIEHRTNSIGRSFSRIAQQQSYHLARLLSQQMEFSRLVAHLPDTVAFLEQANQIPPLPMDQIARIEALWPQLEPNDEPLRSILHNPIAQRWQSIRRMQPRFAEIMLTDATGRLVAASNKTSDYFQADEQWWQDCYDDGRGRAFISDVQWDASALAADGRPGMLVAYLCLPVYDDDSHDARVIGVLKVALDAGWLVGQLDRTPGPEDSDAWLIDGHGNIIAHQIRPGPSEPMPPELMQQIRAQRHGWTIAEHLKRHELMGFSAVMLPRQRPEVPRENWYLIVATDREVALAALHQMIRWIVIAGSAVVLICFIAGLIIARQEIIRPLLALSRGVSELTRGNVDYRLPVSQANGDGIFRPDEIGRLAHDFNHMAEELRSYVLRLREADQRKEQFIDVASHELRTPVTYILGMTQLARKRPQTDPALLGKIAQKAQRLARIVENMFKLLQSGAAQQALHLEPVNIPQLIQEVCQELDPFRNERNQAWQLQLDTHLPTIQADPDKLRDILTNLLSNAIRFSDDGNTLRITATTNSPARDTIEIGIHDSGPGIPQQDLPHLFQPFFTVTNALPYHTSGEYQHMTRGIGLGLSVVKRFVEMHSGTVRMHSSPSGTSVYITLPAQPPAIPHAPTIQASGAPQSPPRNQ